MKFTFFASFKNHCPVLFLLAFILSTIPAAAGADFWEKKEYKEWSQKDCGKMLENSPWAQREEYTEVYVDASENSENSDRVAGNSASNGRPPFIRYQAQLRSALPIRQAIVRQTQIANKYDDMSPEQQQAMDKQTDAFLNANYDDYVVVYVSYETYHRNVTTELTNYWRTQNTDRLKFSVYLTGAKGVKVELLQYTVAEGAEAFQFVFPRKKDGRELIGPEDKDLTLEFSTPAAGPIQPSGQKLFRAGTAFVEFKTKKMTYNDKLEY